MVSPQRQARKDGKGKLVDLKFTLQVKLAVFEAPANLTSYMSVNFSSFFRMFHVHVAIWNYNRGQDYIKA